MVQQELRKLVTYTFFLAILLIPMLGFKTPTFQSGRVFKTLGVFVAILIFNFIVKLMRSSRKAGEVQKTPLTERAGAWINQFPKIYTLGGLIIGGIEVFWAAFLPSAWKDVTTFTVLSLVLYLKPSGLLGEGTTEVRV